MLRGYIKIGGKPDLATSLLYPQVSQGSGVGSHADDRKNGVKKGPKCEEVPLWFLLLVGDWLVLFACFLYTDS